MTVNDVMGFVSTVALALPIVVMLATRLAAYRTFPALVVYYFLLVFYNVLVQGYIHSDSSFIRIFGISNNLIETPLVLTFLTYFCSTPQLKQRMKLVVAAFIGFELIIIALFGFSIKTITIIMGPGLLLILAFCVPFFVRQTKITITHHKATGKSIMIASLLFGYGCYSIIYVMFYLAESPNTPDTFLVYFIVSIISSIIMSVGIFVERKRVKKLSELKVVRKELSELYSNEKNTCPFKACHI